MRFIDLFGGVGGFRLGIEKAQNNIRQIQQENSGQYSDNNKLPTEDTSWGDNRKWECVWYCDNDKYAVQTYNRNFKESYIPTDITKVEADSIPDFDVLCAGFPCQSFSIAGKRKGFEDTRGTLFFEICRIAEHHRPKLLFLENVKGLLNHDKGRTFRTILSSLDKLGYDAQWEVLNSKNFGVPQNRERVFIVANLRGEPQPEVFPLEKGGEEITQLQGFKAQKIEVIGMLSEGGWDKRHESIRRVYSTDGILPTIPTAQGGGIMTKIAIIDKKGNEKNKDIASTLSGGAHSGGNHSYMDLIVRPILTPNRMNKRQDGRRMKENDEPMFSLTGQDIHGVAILQHSRKGKETNYNERDTAGTLHEPSGNTTNFLRQNMRIRRLTPLECERLQGFPDNWTEGVSDTQRYRQMGNAVTVNVIEVIARKLIGFGA